MNLWQTIIISIMVVEAITEVITKSVILNTPRNFLMKQAEFFAYLLTCGYCFSFWATAFILILLGTFNTLPILFDSYLNIFMIFFIIQRGSNMFHGTIDRYFSTSKDNRYSRQDNKKE